MKWAPLLLISLVVFLSFPKQTTAADSFWGEYLEFLRDGSFWGGFLDFISQPGFFEYVWNEVASGIKQVTQLFMDKKDKLLDDLNGRTRSTTVGPTTPMVLN